MTAVLIFAFILASSLNVNPLPAIAVVLLLTAAWLVNMIRGVGVEKLSATILTNYGYWIVSLFVLANVPLATFLDYNFFRWDGRIFFFYAPLLFFCSVTVIERHARRLLLAWLLLTAAICGIALLQYFVGLPLPGGYEMAPTEATPQGYHKLINGLQNTHNAAGTYFSLAAMTWLILLVGSTRHDFPLPRWFLWACTVTIGLAFILTLSREAFVGTIAGLSFQSYRWVTRGRFWQVVAAGMAALILFGIVVASNSAVNDRVFATSAADHNVSTRLDEWSSTARLIASSPVVGIGFSRWNDVFDCQINVCRRQDNGFGYVGIPGLVRLAVGFPAGNGDASPHNSYVLTAAETGFLGLGLLLLLWAVMFRRVGDVIRWATPGSFDQRLGWAAQATIPYALADAMFAHGLGAPAVGLPVSLVVGLAIARHRRETQLAEQPALLLQSTQMAPAARAAMHAEG